MSWEGRGAYSAKGTEVQMRTLRKMSLALYRQLQAVPWRFSWGGFVAVTADHYPHLNHVFPNVMAAMGYNGRGVAMASILGKVLADWASGSAPDMLPFPVTPPQPIPFHFMDKPAVMATVAWSRLRDALE